MSEPFVNHGVVIELNHVDVYQQHYLILRDVNLRVDKGEFCYLIGKTGSGKSTLLKTLYGDLACMNGTGVVVGYDLQKLTWKKLPKLRRKLGIVFQDFNLLTDRNVTENLKFVLKATGWDDKVKMDRRISEVLDEVGLLTKGFKKPFELSAGEQQRIVIARALLNKPELILADEPTGNLDPETSSDIIRLLKKINQETGTPVLMATHDYYTLDKFPGRLIKCQNGLVTETEDIII